MRELLYIPLGLIPSLLFGGRMLILWLQSEKAGHSKASPLFWKLSLAANLSQTLHYIIQVQFPFALIQVTAGVLAWRNLDLMKKRKPLFLVLFLLSISILSLTLLFFFMNEGWARTPFFNKPLSLFWHILGAAGALLFASRFWVQWWYAEKAKTSFIGASFFWLSLIGSLLSVIYFARIRDWISLMQYGTGLIPYMRGLILSRKEIRV